MRSDMIKKGLERTPHRALIKGTGVSESQMDKPFIGVATSFTDLIPGHVGMRDLERFIEKGVHSGGGHAFFFGIPGVCDGIAMGHKGMHYSLPYPRADRRHGRVCRRSSPAGRPWCSLPTATKLRPECSWLLRGSISRVSWLPPGRCFPAVAKGGGSSPLSPTPSKPWPDTRPESSAISS